MKKKDFDCVEMKRRAQAQIMEEMRGLTPEEQRHRTEEHILTHPVLGPFWRRMREAPIGSRAVPDASHTPRR